MPEFCNSSMKLGVFQLPASTHFKQQIALLTLIMVELYFAILSTVTSKISPALGLLVTAYALLSFYAYLGLPSHKLVNMSQSYFASAKLAALCLGFLFDSILSGAFSKEYSFTIMTLLITFDAVLGFNHLVDKEKYSFGSLDGERAATRNG